MKDFLLLVKAMRASSLVLGKKKKNGKPIKRNSFSCSIILTTLFITGIFAYQFYSFYARVNPLGLTIQDCSDYIKLYISAFSLYGFCMCMSFSVSIFYKGNNDIFLSLPITGNRFFLAKLALSLYLNFMYGGFTILAISILTCILFNLSFVSYLIAILIFIIYLVLNPCLCFLLIDFIASFVDLKRSNVATNVISTIFVLLGAASIFMSSFCTSVMPTENLTKEAMIESMNSYSNIFNFVTWIGYLQTKSLVLLNNKEVLYIFILLGFSILVLLFTLFVSKKTYLLHLGKNYQKKQKIYSKEKEEILISKKTKLLNSPNKIAIRREFSSYKNESGLIVSSLLTPLLLIISLSITLYTLKFVSNLEISYVHMLACIFLLTSLDLNELPFVSLSLEKKNISYIKSLPYETKKLNVFKFIPGLIFNYLITFIFSIFLLFVSEFNISFFFSVILIFLSYPFFISSFSYFMGICFPNFNYENISELCKKNKGILICQIVHFVCAVQFTILYVVFNVFFKQTLIPSLMVFGLCISLGILFLMLSKHKLNKFLKSDLSI